MRLIHLFLRKKEHEIKRGVTERTLLGRELMALDARQAHIKSQYTQLKHTTPATAQEAGATSAYLHQQRLRIDELDQERTVMQNALAELTSQLERHHGEKRALELYKERRERQRQRDALYKENETANESYTHRFHFTR